VLNGIHGAIVYHETDHPFMEVPKAITVYDD